MGNRRKMKQSRFYFTVVTVLLVASASCQINQQGSLAGKILDNATKQAVPGASVVFLNRSGIGIITDTLGKFQINNIPTGVYILKISAIGYEEAQVTDVNVTQNKINYLEVEIEEAVQKLSAVTVKT